MFSTNLSRRVQKGGRKMGKIAWNALTSSFKKLWDHWKSGNLRTRWSKVTHFVNAFFRYSDAIPNVPTRDDSKSCAFQVEMKRILIFALLSVALSSSIHTAPKGNIPGSQTGNVATKILSWIVQTKIHEKIPKVEKILCCDFHTQPFALFVKGFLHTLGSAISA